LAPLKESSASKEIANSNRFQAARSNNTNIKAAIAQKIAKRTGKPRQL